MTAEQQRLEENRNGTANWYKWGPYLSERQWGTVREDYSADGNAWNYFPHDHARSRAYRWGEDGLAGVSDDHSLICFALALWNGKDPILKERLFGLTNSEGNHGEDVKEYYFYIDSTPTHSYMKYLYKYPQGEYPYANLVETNRGRSRYEPEYELLDTGIFDEDRYFDVFVEYAKADVEDLLIQVSVINRGPEAAPLHVLPTFWFRNTWSWLDTGEKPEMKKIDTAYGGAVLAHIKNPLLSQYVQDYYFYCDSPVPLLFTENETNEERIFGRPNPSPYVKDGINNYIIHGQQNAVNPHNVGTKVSPHYEMVVAPGETKVIRLRITNNSPAQVGNPFSSFFFDQVFADRKKEADEFYATVIPPKIQENPDMASVMRQALAGMMWTKQYFYYDLDLWLRERGVTPWTPSQERKHIRNSDWSHMYNDDVVSMPDKWEYPWYAAWDLAFHMIPIGLIDPGFAKDQLMLMLRDDYLHPNGQIPAYEWNFGDVNPPVHAWATWEIYVRDRERNNGVGDIDFLKFAFSKLLINFTWWVNRKDAGGNNLFQGGFLGLDNIGVFDRSSPLPTGGYLDQADGTAWMAFFSQRMFQIAIELALHDPLYEEFVIKFFEHTMWIAGAMDRIGEHNDELWDEADGFFYDVLRFPNGDSTRLKVRSMVGLLPLMAVAVFPGEALDKLPLFKQEAAEFIRRHPELSNIHLPSQQGIRGRYMLSILNEQKLRRVLARMLDESEFLSDYGIRALSRYHLDHPYIFYHGGQEYKVGYVPGDSTSGMFGGNSNWRGPIWMPVNLLLIRALLHLYAYYGDAFTVEYPTGSGNQKTLYEVAEGISQRIVSIFLKDESGRRPVYGAAEKFQTDPHWKDWILFYEYFHGDNGAGIGASHQTGWTGCVARLIQSLGYLTPEIILNTATPGVIRRY